jgi:DNA-binding LacI/PurR family transcriptional regulator
MHPIRRLSIAEQTAAHLREGVRSGRWGGSLPGVVRLAAECMVSKGAVRAALAILEKEGVLQGRGVRGCRTIGEAGRSGAGRGGLRVGVFLHERLMEENPTQQNMLMQLQHDLEAAGHVCFFSTKTQAGLHHDPDRMAAHLRRTRTDAWIVIGPRYELLEWLAAQPFPAISTGGRSGEFPVAGVSIDRQQSMREATRHLLALGHERIVFVCPRGLRRPAPAPIVAAFTAELERAGVRWSTNFHVPDWEETPQGFRALLRGLFSATPPTALILDETPRTVAALAFLAESRRAVPAQVSLMTVQWDGTLAWCEPSIAHSRWDDALVIRRLVRWVGAVEKGRADRRMITFPAEFVPGGSTGPVWKG